MNAALPGFYSCIQKTKPRPLCFGGDCVVHAIRTRQATHHVLTNTAKEHPTTSCFSNMLLSWSGTSSIKQFERNGMFKVYSRVTKKLHYRHSGFNYIFWAMSLILSNKVKIKQRLGRVSNEPELQYKSETPKQGGGYQSATNTKAHIQGPGESCQTHGQRPPDRAGDYTTASL